MGKKVLVLSSSPRLGGNSDTLCDQFVRGAQESGNDVEKIFLKDMCIHYCQGCGTCYDRRTPCPQEDDMAEILEKMVAADAIVMATPVYFYSISAQMKTLIDRCCAKITKINHKDFYFILTCADSSLSSTGRALECFHGFLESLDNVKEKGTICGMGTWQPEEIKQTSAFPQAYEAGKAV